MSATTDLDFAQLTQNAKKQARTLLDTGNNRLWLIAAIVLWVATAGAIFSLGSSLVYAADASIMTEQPSTFAMLMTLAAYGLMLVLALLVLVPMTGGVVCLAGRIFERRDVDGKDLFLAYSSLGQYWKCTKLGAYILVQPVLALLVAVLTGLVAPSLLLEGLTEETATSVWVSLAVIGMMLLGICLAALVLYWCRNSFVCTVLMARGMTLKEAKARMRKLCRNCRYRTLGYRASFAGWAVLAILSVGASAVIDTLPYALLCNQLVCDALILQENKNQKLKYKP